MISTSGTTLVINRTAFLSGTDIRSKTLNVYKTGRLSSNLFERLFFKAYCLDKLVNEGSCIHLCSLPFSPITSCNRDRYFISILLQVQHSQMKTPLPENLVKVAEHSFSARFC